VIVVDTSAVVEVLLRTDKAAQIEERLLHAEETLHVPHLLDLEVAQVLRRYCASGEIGPERGQEAIDDFSDFPVIRYPHHLFLPRIWQLRNNMTAYDAAYVALAEALAVALITCDARLASSPGHSAEIELMTAP
jgi:predicted nucleic acid-binding protein